MQDTIASAENVTGRRIVAGLLDLVVLSVVYLVMVLLFGDHGTSHTVTTTNGVRSGNSSNYNFNLANFALIAFLALSLTYYIGTEAVRSATPGKMVMGLRVVSLTEEPLSFGRIVVRNVLRIVDALPCFYLTGIIVVAASKRHQRIGDMAAHTNVARTTTLDPEPLAAPPTN